MIVTKNESGKLISSNKLGFIDLDSQSGLIKTIVYSKQESVISNFILREDGFYILRETGDKFLRENG